MSSLSEDAKDVSKATLKDRLEAHRQVVDVSGGDRDVVAVARDDHEKMAVLGALREHSQAAAVNLQRLAAAGA